MKEENKLAHETFKAENEKSVTKNISHWKKKLTSGYKPTKQQIINHKLVNDKL